MADLCEGFEVLLDSVEGLLSINAELRQEIRDLQKEVIVTLAFSNYFSLYMKRQKALDLELQGSYDRRQTTKSDQHEFVVNPTALF